MINFLKLNVLIGSTLLMLTLTSCKKNPNPVPIPNGYEYFLEFKGENEENLLNGFNINELKTDVVVKTEKGEVVTTAYSILEINNKKFLKINSSTLPNNKVNVLIYEIQNKKLMGDSEKHIIETRWDTSSKWITLTDLFKDGKKLIEVKEEFVRFSHYIITSEI